MCVFNKVFSSKFYFNVWKNLHITHVQATALLTNSPQLFGQFFSTNLDIKPKFANWLASRAAGGQFEEEEE